MPTIFAKWLLTDLKLIMKRPGGPGRRFLFHPGLGKDEVRIAYVLNIETSKKPCTYWRSFKSLSGRSNNLKIYDRKSV